ncbi:MAG: peroxiredoxin [Pseudolabrys sp.]|nr:peroxiredoxin [Pseudolabrys sp.]MBV9955110.1 peroxiredoxin [Pseudolabrys sp.]
MAELADGTEAPAFSLPATGGGTISLKDFKGSKLVLYFFPRADTPGCTAEGVDFSRLRAAFARAETTVIGVSADAPDVQQRFSRKHGLKIALAADTELAMLKAYEAWGEKQMYGRKFLGVIRKTVLIGADGRIARIWPKVKVKGHAEEVLAAARAL